MAIDLLHVDILKRCLLLFLIQKFSYLEGAVLGLPAAHGLFIAEWRFSQVGVSRGYSLAVVHWLLAVVVSLVLEHGL